MRSRIGFPEGTARMIGIVAWAWFPFALGLLGYYPHRLQLVEEFSDIGRSGQHVCIAYHEDWGFEYCELPGENDRRLWHYHSRPCLAGDQRRATWLDVVISRPLDGAVREFVISPYLADREWVVDQIEACDWGYHQLRTVGGEVPETGEYDPDHYFWGAYHFGHEYALPGLVPPVGTPVAVDRDAFALAIDRVDQSPSWDQMTAAGYTWGQVVMTCALLLFEGTPVNGTPLPQLLALAFWAHAAWEAYAHYGAQVLDLAGLPQAAPSDQRFHSFAEQIRGLYPADADISTRPASVGTVKSRFGGPGG